jgi:hypothetical protein
LQYILHRFETRSIVCGSSSLNNAINKRLHQVTKIKANKKRRQKMFRKNKAQHINNRIMHRKDLTSTHTHEFYLMDRKMSGPQYGKMLFGASPQPRKS